MRAKKLAVDLISPLIIMCLSCLKPGSIEKLTRTVESAVERGVMTRSGEAKPGIDSSEVGKPLKKLAMTPSEQSPTLI